MTDNRFADRLVNTPFCAVYSYMKKSNIPSSSTARANGMTPIAEFTDSGNEQTVVYRICREEWKKLTPEKPRSL